MEKPLVSVIIPCYRKAQYLASPLESMQKQTYPSVEIIVVDDGSPDNTREVVEPYLAKMPNLQYIHQENAGVSTARNRGIRASKGLYVMALDADDAIAPTYIERCANYLSAHPEVKLVYTLADTFGIRNGDWYLDDFTAMMEDVYIDVNGDGRRDAGDIYGFACNSALYAIQESFGIEPVKEEQVAEVKNVAVER